MGVERDRIPEPAAYYTGRGLTLQGRGPWITTSCEFHGSRQTMRINMQTGGFVCMAGCGARGGDVLAYEMAVSGQDFVSAARALGAWVDDGKPAPAGRRPFTARDALTCIGTDLHVCVVVIADAKRGMLPSDADWTSFLDAAARIAFISESAA